MKYIKTYEMKDIKVGDYFLVSLLRYPIHVYQADPYIGINGRKSEGINAVKIKHLSDPPSTDTFFAETAKGKLYYLNRNEIYRELTPEEIEQYEIIKSTLKYNL